MSSVGHLWSLLTGCCCRQKKVRNELYEPLLEENERQAVNDLVYYLENREGLNSLTGQPLRAICSLAYSDVLELQQSAALTLAEVTADQDVLLTSESLPPILYLLQSTDGKVQLNTAAALGNLTKNPANVTLFVQHCGVDTLFALIASSASVQAQSNGIACLTNISAHPAIKSALARSEFLSVLLRLHKVRDVNMQRNIAGTLLNLTHAESDRAYLVESGVLQTLANFLTDSLDLETLYRALAALTNIATDASTRRRFIAKDTKLLSQVLQIVALKVPKTGGSISLNQQGQMLHLQCIQLLYNLTLERIVQEALLKLGVLPPLLAILDDTGARSDKFLAALSVLDNLASTSKAQLTQSAPGIAANLLLALDQSRAQMNCADQPEYTPKVSIALCEKVANSSLSLLCKLVTEKSVAEVVAPRANLIFDILMESVEQLTRNRRRSYLDSKVHGETCKRASASDGHLLQQHRLGEPHTFENESDSDGEVSANSPSRGFCDISEVMSPTSKSYAGTQYGSTGFERSQIRPSLVYPLSTANCDPIWPTAADRSRIYSVYSPRDSSKAPKWGPSSPTNSSCASVLSSTSENSPNTGPPAACLITNSTDPLLQRAAIWASNNACGVSNHGADSSKVRNRAAHCLWLLSLFSLTAKKGIVSNERLIERLVSVATKAGNPIGLRVYAAAVLCNLLLNLDGSRCTQPSGVWSEFFQSLLSADAELELQYIALWCYVTLSRSFDTSVANCVTAEDSVRALIVKVYDHHSSSLNGNVKKNLWKGHTHQKSDVGVASATTDRRVSQHVRSKSYESRLNPKDTRTNISGAISEVSHGGMHSTGMSKLSQTSNVSRRVKARPQRRGFSSNCSTAFLEAEDLPAHLGPLNFPHAILAEEILALSGEALSHPKLELDYL